MLTVEERGEGVPYKSKTKGALTVIAGAVTKSCFCLPIPKAVPMLTTTFRSLAASVHCEAHQRRRFEVAARLSAASCDPALSEGGNFHFLHGIFDTVRADFSHHLWDTTTSRYLQSLQIDMRRSRSP